MRYVEYLQGDGGNSWFSTIELPSGTYKIEMKFNYSTIDTSVSNRLIGSANGSFYYQVNQYGNAQVTDADRSYYLLNDLIINDIVTDTFTVNSSGTLCFFGNNSSRLSTAQIYYCKIYDTNDNLLYHFRGALDNNTPCLHEIVSDTIYYNQGTGTFSHGRFIDALYLFANNNEGTAENLGSYRLYNMKIEGDSEGVENGVDYVDCLIGDSASWIDTGIVVRSGYTIDLTFMSTIPSYTGQVAICGSGDVVGYGYDRYGGYGIGVGGQNNILLREIRDENNIDKNFLQSLGDKFTENKKTNFSHKFTNVNNNGSCIVMGQNFCNNGNNTSINYKTPNTVKLYDFKIYNDSNTLLIHLRPCLDKEGIPCMYDEVSGEYFENLGTGTFGYKKELRDFQPVLDSNGVPCLMDKVNKKYYYDKNGKGFGYNGYTRVGYLEGDSASWIDTGIYANPQYKYEIVCYDSSTLGYERYFGVSDSAMSLRVQGSKVNFMYLNSSYSGETVPLNQKNTIIINKHEVYVNGQLSANVLQSTNTTTFSQTVFLFDDSHHGTPSKDLKIYSFKMWNESNELVLDFIPVLDNNNIPCMYDLVTETFFYNQGTGEFSYGAVEELECPPANYVEYIRGSKNAYINTLDISGMINSEVEVEWKFKLEAINNNTGWFGTVGGYNTTPLYARNVYDNTVGNAIHVVFLEPSNNVTIKTEDRHLGVHVMKINKTGLYMDGNLEAELPGTTYYNSYSFVQPFALLGYNYWNGIQNRFWENVLYYVTVKQAGELILDFRPCLDEDGVLCVYEAVNGVYYYNSDTGEFGGHGKSIGYTPIKYIETNGTQYIDTGVVPTDNTDIDMVARATGKGTTYKLDYRENTGYFNYSIPIHVDSFNSVITNHSDVTVRLDCYTESLGWGGVLRIVSGETVDFNASYVNYKYICICFESTDIVKFNEYTFMLNNFADSFTGVYLEDLPACSLYLMNELMLDTTYKFKETNTNVEPNLTASAGATLTLGSTYSAYLTEAEIEQAINNGWIIE